MAIKANKVPDKQRKVLTTLRNFKYLHDEELYISVYYPKKSQDLFKEIQKKTPIKFRFLLKVDSFVQLLNHLKSSS